MKILSLTVLSIAVLGFSTISLADDPPFDATAYRQQIQHYSYSRILVQVTLQFGYAASNCGSDLAKATVESAQKNLEWEDVQKRFATSLNSPACISTDGKLSVLSNELRKRSGKALDAFAREINSGSESK